MIGPGIVALLLLSPRDWLPAWQTNIVAESKTRYCDTETGEELGWLVSPFLNGFAYGYLATRDPNMLDRLCDWNDAWLKRGIKEPDGHIGWPKQGTGGLIEDQLYTDSLLGEAMAFTPSVRVMADAAKWPRGRPIRHYDDLERYLAASEACFRKWDSRGCWRTVENGGLWVVPAFGIDKSTGGWTAGYADRKTAGFSNPDNKENAISEWLLAMYDATGKAVYRDRAAAWFRLMKSRMHANGEKYLVWDYWDPAGPWDYKPDGSTRHWVGVHPNGGYYGIDVGAIVDAYEHHLVFTRGDIDKLIATNRDFMWNQKLPGAAFRRIDGGEPDPRWKDSPGVLWTSLCRYDPTLRKVFEATFQPVSWGGLAETPWYVWRSAQTAGR